MSEPLTAGGAAAVPPRRASARPRRSATSVVLLVSGIAALVSVLGLIATVVLGYQSMAVTGVSFELGSSSAGGAEEYVWEEEGIDALMATAAWGVAFSSTLLVSSVVATIAAIVHLARRARH